MPQQVQVHATKSTSQVAAERRAEERAEMEALAETDSTATTSADEHEEHVTVEDADHWLEEIDEALETNVLEILVHYRQVGGQ